MAGLSYYSGHMQAFAIPVSLGFRVRSWKEAQPLSAY